MIKRKITDQLERWYHDENRQSLIVEGARQVGKTFIIRQFAQKFYRTDWIEINFAFEPSRKEIFSGDISSDHLYFQLSIIFRDIFAKNKRVLLFLDEIQECPQAITALKSFTADPRIDVIASGSLLGVHYNRVSSFPVGYVERLTLYPVDFEEFLTTLKQKDLIDALKSSYQQKLPLPSAIHLKMMEYFRMYIVIGGMPEVLMSYLEKEDYTTVFKTQTKILTDYQDDIAKYANADVKVRAREVFDSIPFQLGKDNKKFQYKYVSKGGRSSMYDSSVKWLIDAGIVYQCNCLSNLEIPLPSYRLVDSFKLYLMDIGLLVSMMGIDAQTSILLNDLGIAKGAIYENVIAVILKNYGHNLYYYTRSSGLEIDFITSKNQQVIAIEVKSGENTKAKSLQTLINTDSKLSAIKLSAKNLSFDDKVLQLPLYMSIFI